MAVNPIDLLLLAIVLFGAWSGWSRGFLFSALDLLTLAISLMAAFFGYRWVTDRIADLWPSLGVWVAPLSFVAIFLLVHFILGTAVLRLLLKLPKTVHGNVGNRLLGVLPGAANGLIHAVVAAVLLLTLPLGARISTWAQESQLAGRLSGPAEWVEARLAPIFDPVVRRTMQILTVQPESRERIALPFRTDNAEPRPDLEEQMLELVNAERRAAGRKPLKEDPIMREVARAHSRDMLARGYFAHVSPDGIDLSERMQQARIGYLTAGENLALAPTLFTAHKGLMNSPGHRANVLRPQFGRVGIGVLDTGVHGLMVTQAFRN